jgi:hypothetical protein
LHTEKYRYRLALPPKAVHDNSKSDGPDGWDAPPHVGDVLRIGVIRKRYVSHLARCGPM